MLWTDKATACTPIQVRATPLNELQSLLAGVPPERREVSSRHSHVSAASPLLDLMLRPNPPATATSSSIVLPSSVDVAAAAAGFSAASTAASAPPASSPSRVCATCQRQYAKYACPRCNLNTCSLACYQSHNSSSMHAGISASNASACLERACVAPHVRTVRCHQGNSICMTS